jgi:hypothetical protein
MDELQLSSKPELPFRWVMSAFKMKDGAARCKLTVRSGQPGLGRCITGCSSAPVTNSNPNRS